MPILPLDHPEPSFATLGVMLYPALNEADPPKARAYVAQVLAKAFSSFRDADETPPYDVLTPILMDAGEPLSDLQERWWGGRAAGELFKTFFALSNTDPVLASWANAIKIVDSTTKSSKVKGARTKLLEARDRFLSVAHLWAARAIRGATPVLRPEIEYDATADFQSFLAEAEYLRHWGQNWHPPRPKSRPPLPADVWQAPTDWEPPARRAGWPKTGIVPVITLPQDLLRKLKLKPAGRPRKRS
jgi:hypothetical protein